MDRVYAGQFTRGDLLGENRPVFGTTFADRNEHDFSSQRDRMDLVFDRAGIRFGHAVLKETYLMLSGRDVSEGGKTSSVAKPVGPMQGYLLDLAH